MTRHNGVQGSQQWHLPGSDSTTHNGKKGNGNKEQGKGRDNSLARQIGEYLVCAELGRRGILATSFAGNVPTFDLLVADKYGHAIPIQVKASRGDSWPSEITKWADVDFNATTGEQKLIGPKAIPSDLIYVCVAIAPLGSQSKDRYFILTMGDVQEACIKTHFGWIADHGGKRPRKPESFHCKYEIKDIAQFEDNWQLIANRLAPAGIATAATMK